MAQHGLVNIKKCDKTSYNEVLGNIEALMGATSSDEHGAYIKQKIETILDNNRCAFKMFECHKRTYRRSHRLS